MMKSKGSDLVDVERDSLMDSGNEEGNLDEEEPSSGKCTITTPVAYMRDCHSCFNRHQHLHDCHVHFQAQQLSQHESEILVLSDGKQGVAVHLGFLELRHIYELSFTVKDSLGEDVASDPNVHVRVKEMKPTEDGEGHDLTVEFMAYKEKVMHEQLVLRSTSNATHSLTLTFQARVLGRGKGTPSLKSGIHCTGIYADDDESESSDWHGFD